MLTLASFERTALRKIFACFTLYAADEESVYPIAHKVDPERKGHVQYMNRILAQTIMVLNKLGYSFNKIKNSLQAVNNFIEHYAFGKTKFLSFIEVKESIGQIIATVLRTSKFNIPIDSIQMFPAPVATQLGGQILKFKKPADPEVLKYEKLSPDKGESNIAAADIYRAEEAAEERKNFLSEEYKKRLNDIGAKARNLSALKRAFVANPALDSSTATTPPADQADTQSTSGTTDINSDTEQIKTDADQASQAVDNLKKKMKEFTSLLGS